jgi:hypothetical protein
LLNCVLNACMHACAVQAKKHERAVSLLVKHAWWERLLSLMRALDAAADARALTAAVAAFRAAGE